LYPDRWPIAHSPIAHEWVVPEFHDAEVNNKIGPPCQPQVYRFELNTGD
jgi:hypothetical protein